jgi:hypothetical protein
MPKGPASFKQLDLKRAIKAILDTGLEIDRVEVDRTGKIVIVPKSQNTPAPEATGWEDVIERGRNARMPGQRWR